MLAFIYGPVTIAEINVVVNAIHPYTGFNTALLLTIPIALLVIYVFYTRYLPVVEFLSIVIPLIPVNNLLLIAGSTPWLVGTGFLFLVAAAYFSVGRIGITRTLRGGVSSWLRC